MEGLGERQVGQGQWPPLGGRACQHEDKIFQPPRGGFCRRQMNSASQGGVYRCNPIGSVRPWPLSGNHWQGVAWPIPENSACISSSWSWRRQRRWTVVIVLAERSCTDLAA